MATGIDLTEHLTQKRMMHKADEFFTQMREFIQGSPDQSEAVVAVMYAVGKFVATSPDPTETYRCFIEAIRDVKGVYQKDDKPS